MQYYVEIKDCAATDDILRARRAVAKIGRTSERGRGTATNPNIYWFEVSSDLPHASEVRGVLAAHGYSDHMVKVEEIGRGEGSAGDRTFPLFP